MKLEFLLAVALAGLAVVCLPSSATGDEGGGMTGIPVLLCGSSSSTYEFGGCEEHTYPVTQGYTPIPYACYDADEDLRSAMVAAAPTECEACDDGCELDLGGFLGRWTEDHEWRLNGVVVSQFSDPQPDEEWCKICFYGDYYVLCTACNDQN